MEIEIVDIESIQPDPANVRQHGERNMQAIKGSLQQFGQQKPVVVNRKGVIVAGNGTLAAARELGWKRVATVRTDLAGAEAVAYAIADNRTAELAEWDSGLAEVLAALQSDDSVDHLATGFDDAEIETLIAQAGGQGPTEQDVVPDPPPEPITQPGELIELGRHRLLCADCTDPEQVRLLMNGRRAILFATDPPYLVGYDGTNHPHKWGEPDKNKDWSTSYGAKWDEAAANPDLYDKFVSTAIAEAIEENAAWYCWHASRNQAMLEAVWEKRGAFVHQQIIWAKDRPILTRSWYMWQHEPLFFGWVRGKKPPRQAKDYPGSVWQLPTVKCGQGTDHPTSKPVEVFAIPMRQHTTASDVCYEPFAGSGSQFIAGEELGRAVYGLELEPSYCDVIVRRYYALVGWDNALAEHRERWQPKLEEATSG